MRCATHQFRWNEKKVQMVRPTFMLHVTVWGVPPASSDETKIKYKWLDLPLRYIWLYEVCHPPVQIKRKKKYKWLDLLLCYIWLYEVCHPPVQMKKKQQIVRPTFMLHKISTDCNSLVLVRAWKTSFKSVFLTELDKELPWSPGKDLCKVTTDN